MLGKLIKMEERIVLDAAVAQDSASDSSSSSDSAASDSSSQASVDSGSGATSDNTTSDSSDSSSTESSSSTATATDSDSASSDTVSTDTTSASTDNYTSLLLISDSVTNYESLAAAAGDGVAVVIYDENDSLADILAKIQAAYGYETFESIGIVCHGETAGTLTLTDSVTVNADSLSSDSAQQAFFQTLSSMLDSDGRLDLLSCYSSTGDAGAALISAMESLTGHEVAGSDDITGNTTYLASDWMLESDGVDAAATYFDTTELAGVYTKFSTTILVNTLSDTTDSDPDVTSLREAIADAASGDTITFDSSLSGESITLTESLYMNDYDVDWTSITIDGDLDNDGVADIAIDGGGSYRVCVNGDGLSVTFDGIIFSNCYGADGGALTINAADVTLDNCQFNDNYSVSSGAAIYIGGGSLVTNNCTYSGNTCQGASNSVVFAYNSTVNTDDFSNSSVGDGVLSSSLTTVTTLDDTVLNDGLISLREAIANAASGDEITFVTGLSGTITLSEVLSISGATLTINGDSNSAVDSDGDEDATNDADITISGNNTVQIMTIAPSAVVTLENLVFSKGNATTDGAISVDSSTLTATGCSFVSNSGILGGAIYALTSTITIEDSSFTSNTATNGGAIYATGGAVVTIKDSSSFAGNTAATSGGAIYSIGSFLTIEDSSFASNTATNGGAIYATTSTVSITESTFGGYKYSSGSYTSVGNSASESGGAIYATGTTTTLNITGGSFGASYDDGGTTYYVGNTSSVYGGAIYADKSAVLNISGVAFYGNSTEGGDGNNGGGAIYGNSATINISNGSSFTANVGNTANGGAIEAVSCVTTISDSVFSKNYTTGGMWGGALCVADGSLYVDNTEFTGNISSGIGGAVYSSGTIAYFTDCTFTNNTSNENGKSITGGISLYIIDGCTFTNTDTSGYEIYGDNVSYFYISNSSLTLDSVGGNVASDSYLDSTVVTSLDDTVNYNDGVITLREALLYSAAGSTITFDSSLLTDGVATITLASALEITKSITIDGADLNEDGVADITLDGNGAYEIMSIVGSADSIITVYLESLNFANGSSARGGAIYTYYSSLFIADSAFSSNAATYSGGAIYAKNSSVTITGSSSFSENSTTTVFTGYCGGAIYVLDGSLSVTGATFTSNTSVDNGGAIFASGSTVAIDDCEFDLNSVSTDLYCGGAIFAADDSILTVKNSSFTNNTTEANSYGGAIEVYESTLYLYSSNFFAGNSSTNGTNVYSYASDITTYINGSVLGSEQAYTGSITDAMVVSSYAVVTTTDDIIDDSDGVISLREAIAYVETYGYGTPITFASTLSGKTIALLSNLSITSSLSINGDSDSDGVADITITPQSSDVTTPLLSIQGVSTEYITVDLSSLIFSGATSTTDGGAIYSIYANLTIRNSTFTGNETNGSDNDACGGAIYAEDVNLTLIGDTFTENSASGTYNAGASGGAVYLLAYIADCSLTIDDCAFTGNTSVGSGGAICIGGANEYTIATSIKNSEFYSNTAANGGAIYGNSCGTVTVSGSTFGGYYYDADGNGLVDLGNTATGSGGAIYVYASTLEVNSSCFYLNDAGSGGAIYGKSCGTMIISGSTFGGEYYSEDLDAYFSLGNTASSNGGAIYANNTGLYADGSYFYYNEAAYGGAIGIYIDGVSGLPVEIDGSTFTGNSGSLQGGAIYVSATSFDYAVKLDMYGDTFTSNSSSGNGGAVYYSGYSTLTADTCHFANNNADTSGGYGGAIYGYNCTMNIIGSDFVANFSAYGGAIAASMTTANVSGSSFSYNGGYFETVDAFTTIASEGGAIYIYSNSSLFVYSSSFTGNAAATSGGAITTALNTTGGIYNSSFNKNSASSGGALYLDSGYCEISYSSFTSNAADSSSGCGGAVYATSTSMDISGSSFIGNSSSVGGGIYASGETIDIYECLIQQNTASADGDGGNGGGIYIDGAILEMADSIISGNVAGRSGGGLYLYSDSSCSVYMLNMMISGNYAGSEGGGVYAAGVSYVYAGYTTITGNSTEGTVGGLYVDGSSAYFVDSIIIYNLDGSSAYADVNSNPETVAFNYSWVGTDVSETSILVDGEDGNILGYADDAATRAQTGATPAYLFDTTALGVEDGETLDGHVTLAYLGTDGLYYVIDDPETSYISLDTCLAYLQSTDGGSYDADGSFFLVTTDINGIARPESASSMGSVQYVPEATVVEEEVVLDTAGDETTTSLAEALSTVTQVTVVDSGSSGESVSDVVSDIISALLSQDSSVDSGSGDYSGTSDGSDGSESSEGSGSNGEGSASTGGDGAAAGGDGNGGSGSAADGSGQANGNGQGEGGAAGQGNANGAAEGVLSGQVTITATSHVSSVSVINQAGNVTSAMVVDVVLTNSLGTYSGLMVIYNNRAVIVSDSLAADIQSAGSQSIVLSVLTVNSGVALNSCDIVLGQLRACADDSHGEFILAKYAEGKDGGDAKAEAGAVSDLVRDCQQRLLKARGVALQANDMLQLVAANIKDFSDRIAENSFQAGLKRLVEANEKMAIEYEVTNALIAHIQQEQAAGHTLTAKEVDAYLSAQREIAEGKAKAIVEGSDRASQDVLTQLTIKMQRSSGEGKEALRGQVAKMVESWHAQIGLSAPVRVDAQDAKSVVAQAEAELELVSL